MCTAIRAGTPACRSAAIPFRAGSAEIAAEDRVVLDRVARCLTAGQPTRLDLGQDTSGVQKERARSVLRYLEDRGVPTTRLRRTLPVE